MTRQRKTPQQRAVDDLELATRVAKRAAEKRDTTRTAATKAQAEYDDAEQRRAFLAGSPFLPKQPAPRTRNRAAQQGVAPAPDGEPKAATS